MAAPLSGARKLLRALTTTAVPPVPDTLAPNLPRRQTFELAPYPTTPSPTTSDGSQEEDDDEAEKLGRRKSAETAGATASFPQRFPSRRATTTAITSTSATSSTSNLRSASPAPSTLSRTSSFGGEIAHSFEDDDPSARRARAASGVDSAESGRRPPLATKRRNTESQAVWRQFWD